MIWFAMIAGAGYLTIAGDVTSFWCGILLLGIAMAHGVELSHQALHHTGFRSPRMNEMVGVALGMPMLVSFYEYRINHLWHHAYLGTPKDKEFFDYGGEQLTLKSAFIRFSLVKHYAAFFKRVPKALTGMRIGDYPSRYQREVRRFYSLAVLFIAALAGVSLALSSVYPIGVWLLSLLLVASPVHALIELPEHSGCDRTSPDVFLNTRTIRSNWFMTWLTNGNNYHVEHHLYPSVPIQKISALHQRLLPRINHYSSGYGAYFKEAIRNRRERAASRSEDQQRF